MDCSRETLFRFARTNADALSRTIRGVVLEFQGLNRFEMHMQPSKPMELELADAGILFVIPYAAPWSWMNESAVRYTNEVLDAIFRIFALPGDTPIVSTGFSMGGLAALMYPVFAERPMAACYANSPVCDLPAHFHERDDVPRTLTTAFIAHPGGVQAGILSRSPLHRLDAMPDIPYRIVAGGLDTDVAKSRHGDGLVRAMERRGMNVIYDELPLMRHWQITNYGVYRAYVHFISGGYKQQRTA